MEIEAPKGLAGIEEHLGRCRLDVMPYLSGYNKKVILKAGQDCNYLEWAMDSSDTDIMIAHGYFEIPVEDAWMLLSDLSIALVAAGFPHYIGIDDEDGNKKYATSFLWQE
ncbi:hypothetical protein [Aliikangiella sp. G2MR2-5]|uniref:hypothetical protein n=1 Tax=Aliikangiella sp. G2MR2-5 TaxID=2788943 RepID=UPI0018A88CD7|nr:hypothetical protein [Aliikangiella sp. G2MR2-5]